MERASEIADFFYTFGPQLKMCYCLMEFCQSIFVVSCYNLRTLARKFPNHLPLKDDELVMSEM